MVIPAQRRLSRLSPPCRPALRRQPRCVSYAARVYDRQNRRGGNYDVPPVYLIGLMGTDISHSDSSLWKDRFISEYTFREKGTGEVLDETIFITFAELARFNKRCTECMSDIDKMMYILKNMGRLKNRPEWLQREVYTKLFDACEIARFNEEKRIQYEKDMYDERRLKGEFAAAEKKGWEKGLEEAIRKMISAGMTVDQVASIMELPVEQVQAFKHD